MILSQAVPNQQCYTKTKETKPSTFRHMILHMIILKNSLGLSVLAWFSALVLTFVVCFLMDMLTYPDLLIIYLNSSGILIGILVNTFLTFVTFCDEHSDFLVQEDKQKGNTSLGLGGSQQYKQPKSSYDTFLAQEREGSQLPLEISIVV